MSIDPKDFAELQSKYASLESALAEEKRLRETAQEDAKAAKEQSAKIARENRRRELSEVVRQNRLAFKGEIPEVVDRLERLQGALSEDDWTAYLDNQHAIHTQLAEGELLKQKGKEGEPPEESALDKALAARIAQGKTPSAALAEVLAENPKFYTEYNRRQNRLAANPE